MQSAAQSTKYLAFVLRNALHFCMKSKAASKPKTDILQIRLTGAEKLGIAQAAALAGIPLSSWVRERLRLAAIRDLESAGRQVPFVDQLPLGESDV